jgi:hypothetical protein
MFRGAQWLKYWSSLDEQTWTTHYAQRPVAPRRGEWDRFLTHIDFPRRLRAVAILSLGRDNIWRQYLRVAAGATWFTVYVAVPPRVVINLRTHTPLFYGSFHPEAESNYCEHCYSGEVCRVDRPLHPKLTATFAV